MSKKIEVAPWPDGRLALSFEGDFKVSTLLVEHVIGVSGYTGRTWIDTAEHRYVFDGPPEDVMKAIKQAFAMTPVRGGQP